MPEAAPEPIRKPGPAEPPSNEDLISQLRGSTGFDRGDWVDRREGGADRAARGDAPVRTWERRDWSP